MTVSRRAATHVMKHPHFHREIISWELEHTIEYFGDFERVFNRNIRNHIVYH